ncbi:MAG: TolC family protein [Bdellovibrionales bacterium]|nr:TolC family protein [Bdellovibrionales bacterium]
MDQALGDGQSHSPRVQRAQSVFDEQGWRRTESLSGFLPKLSLSANHFFSTKYQFDNVNLGGAPLQIPLIYPTTSLTVDVSLPLFDGLQNIHRYSAASWGKDAAEAELDWTRFQVNQDIRLKFYQALAAQRIESVASENVKTLEDHLRRVRELKRAGTSTQYDVLKVEVQLHEAQSEDLAAQDNVLTSRSRLAEAMGLATDARPLAGEMPHPQPAKIQPLVLPVGYVRKDLQALDARVEASDQLDRANGAYWVPKVGLGAQYVSYNNINSAWTDKDSFRSAYNVGIFLNWNIFDGMASIAKSRETAEQQVQTEKTAMLARLHQPVDFEYWKRRYLYSAAVFEAKTSDVEKARESVRLANEGLRSGVRTHTDVLDAELELFRAQAGSVTSQLNAAEAWINLELAMGKTI